MRPLVLVLALTACTPIGDTGTASPEGDADTDTDTDSDADVDTGPVDADGDGWFARDDCDDGNAEVNPYADETCATDYDDDCDGDTNDRDAAGCSTFYQDRDRDGYGDSTISGCFCYAEEPVDMTTRGDCDDMDGAVHPGATETWYDGTDQDCDGASDYDADADGYDSDDYGGTDCDDTDPDINPGEPDDDYDGVDEDCDGLADGCPADAGDGYPAATSYTTWTDHSDIAIGWGYYVTDGTVWGCGAWCDDWWAEAWFEDVGSGEAALPVALASGSIGLYMNLAWPGFDYTTSCTWFTSDGPWVLELEVYD